MTNVTFGLHESFGTDKISKKAAPFKWGAVGWGTFDIPITIKWKTWVTRETTELTHYLCFEGKGKFNNFVLKIHEDKVKANYRELYEEHKKGKFN